MNNQSTRRALTCSFFIFIGPTTIIGHRITVKELRILCRVAGIVDKHHHGLTFNVETLIIIPVIFGCHDTVADKHHVAVTQIYFICDLHSPSHHLSTILHGFRRVVTAKGHITDFVRHDLDQWKRLTITIVFLVNWL